MIMRPHVRVQAYRGGICVFGNGENGVVVGSMDPVGAKINSPPVGEPFLMHSAAYAISCFNYGDLDAILYEDVGTAEASQTGANDCDAGFG
ncbi:hypothetical protein J3458_005887 [Metarhizium acridum]|uniref:uncharacterized protein n=1 Tax=Metarhizium acridum TaxID=92637 RepID=UPI001C6B00C5|nr:hypothetical protein J3458_005887 [Metarhizium acridum]